MSTRHSITGLTEVLKWAENKGYSRLALLEDTQINEERLSDVKATLLPCEELCFYRNLLNISGDPHILLEAGFNLNIATYGIYGLALISSPTFEKPLPWACSLLILPTPIIEWYFLKTPAMPVYKSLR